MITPCRGHKSSAKLGACSTSGTTERSCQRRTRRPELWSVVPASMHFLQKGFHGLPSMLFQAKSRCGLMLVVIHSPMAFEASR